MPNCHVRKGLNTLSLQISSGTLLQYWNQDVETNIGWFPVKSISVEHQYAYGNYRQRTKTELGKICQFGASLFKDLWLIRSGTDASGRAESLCSSSQASFFIHVCLLN